MDLLGEEGAGLVGFVVADLFEAFEDVGAGGEDFGLPADEEVALAGLAVWAVRTES